MIFIAFMESETSAMWKQRLYERYEHVTRDRKQIIVRNMQVWLSIFNIAGYSDRMSLCDFFKNNTHNGTLPEFSLSFNHERNEDARHHTRYEKTKYRDFKGAFKAVNKKYLGNCIIYNHSGFERIFSMPTSIFLILWTSLIGRRLFKEQIDATGKKEIKP